MAGSLPLRLSCTSLPSAQALLNFLSCTCRQGLNGWEGGVSGWEVGVSGWEVGVNGLEVGVNGLDVQGKRARWSMQASVWVNC